MATLNIDGQRVTVSDDFLSLTPEEQNRTVEEIASQLGPRQSAVTGSMSQVNRGIADAAGGIVDFLNPFDKPHALNPFKEGTGSAQDGIAGLMEGAGIQVAEGEPANVTEAFLRGTGEAAGAMLPATKGLQALSRAPGLVGRLAADSAQAIGSVSGVASEALAGGAARSGEKLAEEAGAPEWAQQTAGVLAGGAVLPATIAAPKLLPSVAGGKRVVGAIKRAVAPHTEGGGREIAARRLQSLAGGEERAGQLARRITPENELGLTPAQQTEDPSFIGLERLAADQDPALRARLDTRAQASQDTARGAVGAMGGDEAEAARFFEQRRAAFSERLSRRANEALAAAERQIAALGPARSESENGLIARRAIDQALDRELLQERALWEAVPKEAMVPTARTREAIQQVNANLPYAQRNDMPRAAREVIEAEGVYGSEASVRDLHGLYSELRRVARSAMAGNDQNKNAARIANEVADAVLKDLGAADGSTLAGRRINEARAFSAALHERFDRGAVGRLLKRSLDGDASVDPELSLRRTVGRAGPEGAVGARQIEAATGSRASGAIQDFIRDRFTRSATGPDGEFTRSSAGRFIRDNRELLALYPELRGEIENAVRNRETAGALAERVTRRLGALRQSSASGQAVIDGQTVKAVLSARSPAREAHKLASEARKDSTGQALAGLKAAFANHLIGGASGVRAGRETFSGDALLKLMSDSRTAAALPRIFSKEEIGRLRRIGHELAKLDAGAAGIGASLSGERPARVIEYLARVVAARHGAQLGGGGGASLQTAQMASARVKELLASLVSDKASEILARAVEDPELFKDLLLHTQSPKLEQRLLPRLAPYLLGTSSALGAETD
ncbi:hypothetical protein [Pseudooceanicola marinus]|uniref:hypothetical protein n=1 Tax=Pseudooceanicola marinus TaxID=396013 RepID=UPI001CD438F5|nr:hypothetical protein [Pseudooceanicola marinus]MCA1338102.1 hypothetical protein [Pseudooceanicola marinus]